jgi:hypothetical protein
LNDEYNAVAPQDMPGEGFWTYCEQCGASGAQIGALGNSWGRYCRACGTGANLRRRPYPDVIRLPWPGAPPAQYGCHNRTDKSPIYLAQDGYSVVDIGITGAVWTRTPQFTEVPHVMSEDCRYDKRATDSKCAGCRHKGEAAE